jgi:hypothetical protein
MKSVKQMVAEELQSTSAGAGAGASAGAGAGAGSSAKQVAKRRQRLTALSHNLLQMMKEVRQLSCALATTAEMPVRSLTARHRPRSPFAPHRLALC